MRMPLLVSVPHAGLRIPDEVQALCILSPEEIVEDSDVGAREIYDLRTEVAAFVTTDVARAIIDLNRAEDDRRADGVVKTHTCWNVPVYRTFPPDEVVESLLATFHRPYHARLRDLSRSPVVLGVDCHTMAATGPPVGPDPGVERPWVCLSNGDGTCPQPWIDRLARCFRETFGNHVKINDPFTGGYITRSHAEEMPWVQLELSRASFMTDTEKRDRVVAALRAWCDGAI